MYRMAIAMLLSSACATPVLAASIDKEWSALIYTMVKAGGKHLHGCQVSVKNCFDSLEVTFNDGTSAAAIIRTSPAGVTLRRELCKFNKTEDVRKCVNFDTKDGWTQMKDIDGEWYTINE